ncbi:unnamed protein product [Camellia sinensis]
MKFGSPWSMTSISIAWQRPPARWVKVNVDGATTKRSGHAVYGGLILSAQGTWSSDSSIRWKFLLFLLPNCGVFGICILNSIFVGKFGSCWNEIGNGISSKFGERPMGVLNFLQRKLLE